MAKLSRSIMKIFGLSGGTGEFGQIGSKAAGSAATSKDIETIQALSGYLQGLFQITSDQGTSRLPYTEDMNSLFYLMSSQLSYLFQNGIPEWLESTDQRYYADVSVVTRSGGIYLALQGDDVTNINTQKDPATEPLWWTLIWQKPVVEAWDVTEAVAYEDAGVLVDRFGKHYTSTGLAGNTGKDPINPANKDFWYRSPGVDKLIELANKGQSERGGMHKVNNVQDADYQTALLLDKAKFGATTYDFYLVHLDGSAITGNATLEAIFDPDGAKEYPFIDLYAPEELSVKTLVDKRGYIDRPMTDVGGVAATLAEMQMDQMQRITGSYYPWFGANNDLGRNAIAEGALKQGTVSSVGRASTGQGGLASPMLFDSADSPDARTSATTDGETRDRSMVEGLGYIIVMIAE